MNSSAAKKPSLAHSVTHGSMATAAGESTRDIYESFAAYEQKRTKKIQERYSNKTPATKSHKQTGFGSEVRSAYKQFQNSRLPLTKSV